MWLELSLVPRGCQGLLGSQMWRTSKRSRDKKEQEIGETDGDVADREGKEKTGKKGRKILPIIPSSSF